MKALMRSYPSILSIVRKALIMLLLFGWLVIPELMWQKLSLIAYKLGVILHLIYETWAFLMEEALIHGMDMPKQYAQMLVFYLSLLIGVGVLCWCWWRLPYWLKRLQSRLELFLFELKFQMLKTWICLSMWQKVKFMLIQLLAVVGVFTMIMG